ncbi:FtsK/SpoIIIE domain-containing protein [Luteimicrobium subarcticum]|uniref:S-DNA-T family DNA segregation ATPase FtsK/SpoIIIE n=1 Tax=Luteimicrobium subarcticum TaxID=620910 RepID=A0A2M8W6M1_9MICO|nr:FtsK/SpoIIIE domain-containing protein [Luteimicrobium subarcticum]PJI86573.1 S-DNA-T family DNA segregation ATPase FtsK/SpoIIIE [Luteimicrobium subarcticum]
MSANLPRARTTDEVLDALLVAVMAAVLTGCFRLAWWLVRVQFRLVWWLVRRPSRLAVAVVPVVLVVEYDQHPATDLAGAGALLVAVVVWAWRWPASFRRRVIWRLRGLWRGVTYRRLWATATTSTGLDVRDLTTGDRVVPGRSPIVASKHAEYLRVRMLPGQTLEDWASRTEQLATMFNAMECRVRPAGPGRFGRAAHRNLIDVTMLRRDVLAQPIGLDVPAEVPDFHALPVAWTEDGERFTLDLLGHHVLIGGATGAGKGSALWSTICQLAPATRTGLVQLFGIDPKSLEFPYGAGLFTDVVDGDPETMADALEGLVSVMNRRKAAMRGRSRLHTPTVAEPFIVVVVDELAALTAYVPVAQVRKRTESALALLLTQGRAMAISVIAAAQDPRKETLTHRNLFTTRIGMRLNEPGDVDMLLGDAARSRGALCDRIRHQTPGVAWVIRDGDPGATRIRFPWISDDTIREYATTYAKPPAPTAEDAPVVELHPTGDKADAGTTTSDDLAA